MFLPGTTIRRGALILLAAILTGTGGLACDSQYEEEQEVPHPALPPSLEPQPGTLLAEGVVLEEASVRLGTLSQVAHDVESGRYHREGDRCLLVSGQLRNTTTATVDVDLWVDGYDADGDRVASTLSTGTQEGQLHLSVPADSTQSFEIAVNRSTRTRSLKIAANTTDGISPPRYAAGQVLSTLIEPAPGATLAEGVVLEDASVRTETLKLDAFNVKSGRYCDSGDWCLLVSGRVRNTTTETLDVDLWVDGYDCEGKQVASTLASGTQEGYLHLDVPGVSSLGFEIAVSWGDDIRSLEISADVGNSLMPPPAVPPSASPSGPISVSPPVGSYLTSGSKGGPSELLLLAAQVEKAPSNRQYHCDHEPDEVIDPGDPILVVTGSFQNRHRTYSAITMHAKGYDAAGTQVSWTLDSASIPGQIGLEIEPGEVGEFTMHLNPSEGITAVQLFASIYPVVPP